MGLSTPAFFLACRRSSEGSKAWISLFYRNPLGPPTHPGGGRGHYLNFGVILELLMSDDGYRQFLPLQRTCEKSSFISDNEQAPPHSVRACWGLSSLFVNPSRSHPKLVDAQAPRPRVASSTSTMAPSASRGPSTAPAPGAHMKCRVIACACIAFFLRFTALGAIAPYVFLWLSHGGHSTATIGILGAVYRAIGTITPAVIGGLADAHMRHREYLLIASLLNAVAVASLTFWPGSAVWQGACLAASALTDTSSLLDAIIVRSMAFAGATDAAPRSRAFGALGWILAAPAFGAFNKAFGLAWLLRLYVPLLCVALPFCAALPIRRAYAFVPATAETGGGDAVAGSAADKPAPKPPFLRRVRSALRAPRTLVQLLLTLLIGIHFGVSFTYGFLFLEQVLHASPMQLALSTTCQAVIEMPVFQVAAPLIRRMGCLTALLTCMAAATLRFTGYITMPNAYAVLPFEVGHGWSFALVYTATALLGEESHLESGVQATVVGLANSMMQLGTCLATLVWAGLISEYGMRTAFTVAASLFAVASVPLVVPLVDGLLKSAGFVCRKRRSTALLGRGTNRSDDAVPPAVMMTSSESQHGSQPKPADGHEFY